MQQTCRQHDDDDNRLACAGESHEPEILPSHKYKRWDRTFEDENQLRITRRSPYSVLARDELITMFEQHALVNPSGNYCERNLECTKNATRYSNSPENWDYLDSLTSESPAESVFMSPEASQLSSSPANDLSVQKEPVFLRPLPNLMPNILDDTNHDFSDFSQVFKDYEPFTPETYRDNCLAKESTILRNQVSPKLRTNRIYNHGSPVNTLTSPDSFRNMPRASSLDPGSKCMLEPQSHVSPTTPRKTGITETSTSPFVRRWVHKPRNAPIRKVSNPTITRTTGYMIPELEFQRN